MIAVKSVINDIFFIPSLGTGMFKVWLRNFFYFRNTWIITLFWTVFEPVLYLFAIGVGLGQFVGQIEGVSYAIWFFPGLLASTAMMVPFFECTYGTFTKLVPQKTFSAILTTPVSVHEIAFGEILWALSKGFLGVLGVAIVGAFWGHFTIKIFLAFGILILVAWVFAALGLLVTTFVSHYDAFIYMQSGFIMPMYLFSGTYFPVSQLPKFLQVIAWATPLYHGVEVTRAILLDRWNNIYIASFVYLFALALILSNWGAARMHRKLIY